MQAAYSDGKGVHVAAAQFAIKLKALLSSAASQLHVQEALRGGRSREEHRSLLQTLACYTPAHTHKHAQTRNSSRTELRGGTVLDELRDDLLPQTIKMGDERAGSGGDGGSPERCVCVGGCQCCYSPSSLSSTIVLRNEESFPARSVLGSSGAALALRSAPGKGFETRTADWPAPRRTPLTPPLQAWKDGLFSARFASYYPK